MSYIKTKNATLVKKIGINPIYKCNDKFYVGIETLIGMGEEIENCIDCDSLEDAETVCMQF